MRNRPNRTITVAPSTWEILDEMVQAEKATTPNMTRSGLIERLILVEDSKRSEKRKGKKPVRRA